MPRLPEMPRIAHDIEKRIDDSLLGGLRGDHSRDGIIGASDIGGCERNLWAKLNGILPDREFKPALLRIFSLGHAIEYEVIKLLRGAGYVVRDVDPKTGVQYEATDFDDRFVVHPDGFITHGNNEKILEVKSASEARFDELAKAKGAYAEWSAQYNAQIQMCMGYFGYTDSVVFVYAKNRSHFHIEKIRFDLKLFDLLREKAERIITSATVLGKPEAAKSQYCKFCKWCDRNEWCWSPVAEVKFDK